MAVAAGHEQIRPHVSRRIQQHIAFRHLLRDGARGLGGDAVAGQVAGDCRPRQMVGPGSSGLTDITRIDLRSLPGWAARVMQGAGGTSRPAFHPTRARAGRGCRDRPA